MPSKSLFPQSCVSSGGSAVGLVVTSSKRAYTIPRSAAPKPLQQATDDMYLHRRHSDTVLAQSLWVGPPFCALPRSEYLRQPGAWQAHCSRWLCILITSLDLAAWLPGCAMRAPLRCAACLLWRADLRLRPSWQMSTIQDLRKTWLAAGSLLTVRWKMPSLGLRVQ